MNISEDYNECHQRKETCKFIYIQKSITIVKFFLIQNTGHFAESKTVSVTLLYSNGETLYVTRFSWTFWIWLFCTKSMTLCVIWRCYIQKDWHFVKSKKICIMFKYKNTDTLRYHILLNFCNWQRAMDIFICKKQCFCVTLIFSKMDALSVMFLNTKRLTLCVTFSIYKKNALCLTFYM